MALSKHIQLSPISYLLILSVVALAVIIFGFSRASFAASQVGCISSDTTIDSSDLTALISAWGTNNSSADLNGDGTVNALDLSILLSNWGKSCSSTNSSGNGLGIIEEGGNFSVASNPSQYSMIIVSTSDATTACAVPKPTRDLIYFDGTSVNQSYSNGVPWGTANANGWLLKDASGNLLVNQAYPTNNIGDVGNSAYQQTWISNVSSFLAANHCGGVFIDDVASNIEEIAGEYPAEYPNQPAWQAAMADFVSVVGPALKAEGYYVAINADAYIPGNGGSDDGSLQAQWFTQLGPYVSGIDDEYWQQTADGNYTLRVSGSAWYQNWDGWQAVITATQKTGADFIGLSYAPNTDTQTMRYTRGSLLLLWNGGGGAYIFDPFDSSDDPYNAAWTYNIGTPTAAETEPLSGVWERAYTNGVVIVNPTGSSVTVDGHTIASADAYIGP